MNHDFIGVWRLVECQLVTGDNDVVAHPLGIHPVGTLIYTANQWVSVSLSASDRNALSNADPHLVEDGEAAHAFRSYIGYAGRYEIRGETVIHRPETASIPNMVCVDQIRHVSLTRDLLVLRAPTVQTADGTQTLTLRWTRV